MYLLKAFVVQGLCKCLANNNSNYGTFSLAFSVYWADSIDYGGLLCFGRPVTAVNCTGLHFGSHRSHCRYSRVGGYRSAPLVLGQKQHGVGRQPRPNCHRLRHPVLLYPAIHLRTDRVFRIERNRN